MWHLCLVFVASRGLAKQLAVLIDSLKVRRGSRHPVTVLCVMAEAIGIASGIVGTVTFAIQGTKVLLEVIKAYKDAASTLTDLAQDVDATSTILAAIKNSLEEAKDDSFSESVRNCLRESIGAVEGCGKACEDFAKELSDLMSHSKDGKFSKRDKLKLWFEEETIKGFRYRLGNYKSTLNMVLTLASIWVSINCPFNHAKELILPVARPSTRMRLASLIFENGWTRPSIL